MFFFNIVGLHRIFNMLQQTIPANREHYQKFGYGNVIQLSLIERLLKVIWSLIMSSKHHSAIILTDIIVGFWDICNVLDSNDPSVAKIPSEEMTNYLEVKIMVTH